MKKMMNQVEDYVAEGIDGFVGANSNVVKRLKDFPIVVRSHPKEGKVALVSGGGSGHEPAHMGYVGEGMLDAAVCGDIFTSPTPDMIYEAIKAVDTGKGVLLIIKNYTGDVMNFEMAMDMAAMDDIKVASVVVNDDVAVEDSTYTAGRRGVAGTVFVHKIAGALAERGADLDTVARVAQRVIDQVRTMGVATTSCIVPAAGKPHFDIADDEIELGVGIHGEPGVSREKMATSREIVNQLLDHILDDIDYKQHDVAVMINGLSGTPLSELCIMNYDVMKRLESESIPIYRTFIGEYMTSLDMAGASITLLRLDDDLKELLDAPTKAVAFH